MTEDQAEKDEGAAPSPDETIAGETATLSRGNSHPNETERRPPVEPATAPSPEEADLRDVAGTVGSFLRGRVAALTRLVREHRVASAVTALVVVAAAVAVAAAALAGPQLPSRELVEQDALARLQTPDYSPGSFGRDDVLVARDVEIRAISPGEDRDHARAEVLVTYSGSYVQAQRSATLGYAREGGGWVAGGDPSDVRVSWQALADPDPNKIVSNASVLLAQADRQLAERGEDDGVTLEQLYANAEVRVDRFEADLEQGSCSVEITCTRAGTFETYECRLSAGLAFRSSNGQWEVERLSVADGGKTRSLEPLVGTWEGTFVGQETDGTKCLAGRGSDLVLNVESAVTEGGISQVSGTIAGMAHYHAHPAQDTEGCAGDLELVNVPFTATLVDDADGTLVLEATLPEDVGGTTSLTLRLGEKDNPTAATAEVTSSYQHTGSFLFFPVEETLTYVDVFTLTHVE